MFTIVATALYGALLGLSIRPAMRAVALAVASVAVVQYAVIWLAQLILHRSGMEGVAWTLQNYAGVDARDLVPTVSVAAFAAALAALITAVTQSSEQRRRGKRVAAIED